jgi:hypothetical protein
LEPLKLENVKSRAVARSAERTISRRNFFKLVGGGVAAAIAAPQALASKVTQIPVEFGWTWYYNDKVVGQSEFSKLITETLRKNSSKIRENISQNNVLLAKLKDGTKVQLNIERISEEEQTRRMQIRLEHYLEEKQKERLKDKVKNNGKMYEYNSKDKSPFYEGYREPVIDWGPVENPTYNGAD